MDKNNPLQFLNGLKQFGWKLGLDNINKILNEMSDPHFRFKSVHIAGTNGKGSTAAIMESIFRKSGYKTALFTSPHLVNLCERIRVDGSPISEETLKDYLKRLKDRIEKIGCTYFESLTAVAFQYFADTDVDIALIEVGLGGRFDATNVIQPELSIITQIGLDHTQHLGKSIPEITREKGGIIKDEVPCLSQSTDKDVNSILRRISKERKSEFYELSKISTMQPVKLSECGSQFDLTIFDKKMNNLKLGLAGEHQLKNAATAIAACEILKRKKYDFIREDIYDGLRTVKWRGRLEKIKEGPKIIVDVAHNPGSFSSLMKALKRIYDYDRLIILFGLLKDKNYEEISKVVAQDSDHIFITAPISEHALRPQELAKEIAKYSNNYFVCSDLRRCLRKALAYATKNDLICITGSHYIVGEFLKFYKKSEKEFSTN